MMSAPPLFAFHQHSFHSFGRQRVSVSFSSCLDSTQRQVLSPFMTYLSPELKWQILNYLNFNDIIAVASTSKSNLEFCKAYYAHHTQQLRPFREHINFTFTRYLTASRINPVHAAYVISKLQSEFIRLGFIREYAILATLFEEEEILPSRPGAPFNPNLLKFYALCISKGCFHLSKGFCTLEILMRFQTTESARYAWWFYRALWENPLDEKAERGLTSCFRYCCEVAQGCETNENVKKAYIELCGLMYSLGC